MSIVSKIGILESTITHIVLFFCCFSVKITTNGNNRCMKKTKYAGKYPPAKEYRANADEKETALPKQFQRAFVEENLSK